VGVEPVERPSIEPGVTASIESVERPGVSFSRIGSFSGRGFIRFRRGADGVRGGARRGRSSHRGGARVRRADPARRRRGTTSGSGSQPAADGRSAYARPTEGLPDPTRAQCRRFIPLRRVTSSRSWSSDAQRLRPQLQGRRVRKESSSPLLCERRGAERAERRERGRGRVLGRRGVRRCSGAKPRLPTDARGSHGCRRHPKATVPAESAPALARPTSVSERSWSEGDRPPAESAPALARPASVASAAFPRRRDRAARRAS
jgi:hypothetical protein